MLLVQRIRSCRNIFRPYALSRRRLRSQRHRIRLNRFQIALSFELLHDIRLLSQHESIRLCTLLRESPPSLKVLRITLVAMSLLRVIPMAFRKRDERGDLLPRHVVHKRADGARLLEPIALPEFAGSDALELAGLVVDAAGHGPAVDRVDAAVLGEEPHLVPPFLGFAVVVFCVVVVD